MVRSQGSMKQASRPSEEMISNPKESPVVERAVPKQPLWFISDDGMVHTRLSESQSRYVDERAKNLSDDRRLKIMEHGSVFRQAMRDRPLFFRLDEMQRVRGWTDETVGIHVGKAKGSGKGPVTKTTIGNWRNGAAISEENREAIIRLLNRSGAPTGNSRALGHIIELAPSLRPSQEEFLYWGQCRLVCWLQKEIPLAAVADGLPPVSRDSSFLEESEYAFLIAAVRGGFIGIDNEPSIRTLFDMTPMGIRFTFPHRSLRWFSELINDYGESCLLAIRLLGRLNEERNDDAE